MEPKEISGKRGGGYHTNYDPNMQSMVRDRGKNFPHRPFSNTSPLMKVSLIFFLSSFDRKSKILL